MEKVLHKRLADYAASLSGVLLLQPAQGQIIVHSAEPYLEGAVDQPVSLDFNDDGFTELEFFIEETHVVNIGSSQASYYDEQEFFVMIPRGYILSADNYIFPYISGPSMMGFYDMVSESRNWNHDLLQLLVKSRIKYTIPDFEEGNWRHVNDTAYLGLKLKINNESHYGWVRLNVDYLESNFTILDYAYNIVPDAYIRAGQTDQQIYDLQAVQSGTSIIVSTPDFWAEESVHLMLSDMSGHIHWQGEMTPEAIIQISMEQLEPGFYIVTMFDSKINRSVKVVYTGF